MGDSVADSVAGKVLKRTALGGAGNPSKQLLQSNMFSPLPLAINCFNFEHGTRKCRMKPRCNKCGEPHPTEECDKMEVADAKCANCGDKHRATTKDCPKRAAFLEIRKKASTRTLPKKNSVPVLNEVHCPTRLW